MGRIILGFIAIVLSALFWLNGAYAAERMGSNRPDDYFKIDGKRAESALEAQKAASGHTIQRCKYIKNSEPAAFKCDEVVYEYNAKTGGGSWKRP